MSFIEKLTEYLLKKQWVIFCLSILVGFWGYYLLPSDFVDKMPFSSRDWNVIACIVLLSIVSYLVFSLLRYLFSKGYSIKGTNLSFKDRSKVGTVALPYMKQAQTIGLLEADENGKIDPKGKITRSDAVVMLMRAYRYMQSHGA